MANMMLYCFWDPSDRRPICNWCEPARWLQLLRPRQRSAQALQTRPVWTGVTAEEGQNFTLIRLCSELMSGRSLLLLSRCLRTKHKPTLTSQSDEWKSCLAFWGEATWKQIATSLECQREATQLTCKVLPRSNLETEVLQIWLKNSRSNQSITPYNTAKSHIIIHVSSSSFMNRTVPKFSIIFIWMLFEFHWQPCTRTNILC